MSTYYIRGSVVVGDQVLMCLLGFNPKAVLFPILDDKYSIVFTPVVASISSILKANVVSASPTGTNTYAMCLALSTPTGTVYVTTSGGRFATSSTSKTVNISDSSGFSTPGLQYGSTLTLEQGIGYQYYDYSTTGEKVKLILDANGNPTVRVGQFQFRLLPITVYPLGSGCVSTSDTQATVNAETQFAFEGVAKCTFSSGTVDCQLFTTRDACASGAWYPVCLEGQKCGSCYGNCDAVDGVVPVCTEVSGSSLPFKCYTGTPSPDEGSSVNWLIVAAAVATLVVVVVLLLVFTGREKDKDK